jgi:hypothetical protein
MYPVVCLCDSWQVILTLFARAKKKFDIFFLPFVFIKDQPIFIKKTFKCCKLAEIIFYRDANRDGPNDVS